MKVLASILLYMTLIGTISVIISLICEIISAKDKTQQVISLCLITLVIAIITWIVAEYSGISPQEALLFKY